MDKASYFEKLVESLSRIASHSYYPGKEDTVEQCLEEVEEIRLSGQITPNNRQLSGNYSSEKSPSTCWRVLSESNPAAVKLRSPPKLPSHAKVRGVMPLSRRASSKGSWNKTVTTARSQPSAACLAGLSVALLAWDGLLRGDPQRAVDQLQGFWQDYSATCLIDNLLNYSAQMAFHLRSMVAFPCLIPYFPALSQDQLRRMLERRVNFAEARSMAGNEDAPGLTRRCRRCQRCHRGVPRPANQRRSYPRLGSRSPPVLSGRPVWPHPGRRSASPEPTDPGADSSSDPMKSG